jgi:hypothetical protein
LGLALPRPFSAQVARQGATSNFTLDCMRSGRVGNAMHACIAQAIRHGQIFQASGVVRWGRDVSMKLLGERLLDIPWLYGGP